MKKYSFLLIFLLLFMGRTSINAQFRERAYLQTDKQMYLAGELLWLKMYTTDMEGRLTSFSKIGYVELIRDSIPEIQVKLDIQGGTGAGWMELPAMLPTGYYRITAYTRYMRNEGESVFFEKTIAIVNPFNPGATLYEGETNTSFTVRPVEKNMHQVNLSVDKPSYAKRSKGEIRLTGLPAENISFGVSIAGIDPVLEANTSITEWKRQLTGSNTPFAGEPFLPEYEGAIIDGVLIDQQTGQPAADPQSVNLLSFPGREIQLFAGQADRNGHIAFYTQCVTGKQEMTTTAIAGTGKKYRVDVQPPFALHTPVRPPFFNPDSTWRAYLQRRNLDVQITHAYMADSLSRIKKMVPCSWFRPNSRYELDEYTRFPNMEEVFIEFITFARIRRTNEGRIFTMMTGGLDTYTNNVLVLLDNIPVADHELLCSYSPLQIKTIEIHQGRYMFGGHLFDGIITFYSYKNDFPGITFGANTQLFDYEGTQPYRYFYAPDYDDTNKSSRMPDFRHSLLWEPTLQSYGQTELVIPFTTSDLTGSFVITVEGIGANGTVVSATQEIEVQ